MEINEKIQQLRKQKGLTQEELAELLFVSRTAISKWESGRGYPSIDSLKAISKVFSVSIDELLSSEEMITIAEEDKKKTAIGLRTLLYGLLDVIAVAFIFLPLYGEPDGNVIKFMSLPGLSLAGIFIRTVYFAVLGLTAVFGVVELVLQNHNDRRWAKYSGLISLLFTIAGTTVFIMSLQPYMAFFLFWILVLKGFLYIKQQ